jgi:hypothetical protein
MTEISNPAPRESYLGIVQEGSFEQRYDSSGRSELNRAIQEEVKKGNLTPGEAEAAVAVSIAIKNGWVNPSE